MMMFARYAEPQSTAQGGQQGNGAADGGEDEDADPLDAFMTDLHAPPVAQARYASFWYRQGLGVRY